MAQRQRARRGWQRIVAVYVAVQFAEIFGVSMIYAYLPLALEGAGVPISEIGSLAAIATAGLFIVGAPQVPIWLAIAELRSRRLVIVRSGLIALAALVAFALAREAWQIVGATVALGFWLGNSGVMLATIREVAPPAARQRSIALFSAAAPMGFAAGPLLAALCIEGLGLPLAAPILIAAAVNGALIVANIVAIPDVPPIVRPRGSVLTVALRGLRGIFADRVARAAYLVLALVIAGERMLRPILPLRIAEVAIGPAVAGIAEPLASPGIAGAVGLLTGLSALAGAIASPLLVTLLFPRLGLPRAAALTFIAGSAAALSLGFAPTLPLLAIGVTVIAAVSALVQTAVFSYLAEEVRESRRTAALSLSLFPLYAGNVVGLGVASIGVQLGTSESGDLLALRPVFVAGGAVLLVGFFAARALRGHTRATAR